MRSKPTKIKVFIVDDHPVVRYGLTQLINQEKNWAVCGEVEQANKAIDAIKKLKPDLAIVSLFLRGVDDMELIKSIKACDATLPVLVFSMHDESLFAERVIRAGAKGYIMKQEPVEQVIKAIHRVLAGEIYMSDKMVAKLLSQLADRHSAGSTTIESLSDRELQIFQLIGKGHDLRRIAKELYLSIKTVESHCAHIKEKLKLKNSTELTHHAIKWVDSGGEI